MNKYQYRLIETTIIFIFGLILGFKETSVFAISLYLLGFVLGSNIGIILFKK
jgi:hypothetical protein